MSWLVVPLNWLLTFADMISRFVARRQQHREQQAEEEIYEY